MALFPQKQPLRFHESSELDTETGTLALSHPAYILAFWAVGRLQEESASPIREKPVRAQNDLPAAGSVAGSSVAQTQADILSVPQ